jgi:hypothetical protein
VAGPLIHYDGRNLPATGSGTAVRAGEPSEADTAPDEPGISKKVEDTPDPENETVKDDDVERRKAELRDGNAVVFRRAPAAPPPDSTKPSRIGKEPLPAPSAADPADQKPEKDPQPADGPVTALPETVLPEPVHLPPSVPDPTEAAPATPADPTPFIDSDGDGLSDENEIAIGTDPHLPDTDHDKFRDGDEYGYWTNRGGVSPLSDSDYDTKPNILDIDSDNDGFSDGEEWNAGTDPLLPDNVEYIEKVGAIATESWCSGGTYYVRDDLFIKANETLLIEQGAVVKFASGVGLFAGSSAAIVACGSPENPVIFTSMHDDTVGGLINGSTGAPAPGDFDGIHIETDVIDGSIVQYCEIRYASDPLVVVATAPFLPVMHNAITVYSGTGVTVTYDDATHTGENLILANNLITDGRIGVAVLRGSEFALYNNTMDNQSHAGLTVTPEATRITFVDNLISNSRHGVLNDGDRIVCTSNAFWNNAVDLVPPLELRDRLTPPLILDEPPYAPEMHYYLNQDGPLIDRGSRYAVAVDLDQYTTSPDGIPDSGKVDIGYHYPSFAAEDVGEPDDGAGGGPDDGEAHGHGKESDAGIDGSDATDKNPLRK